MNTLSLKAEHKNPAQLKYEAPFVIINAVCHHYQAHISRGQLALPRSMTVLYKKAPNERTTEIKDLTQSQRETPSYASSSIPKTGLLFLVPKMKGWEGTENDNLITAIDMAS